MEKWTWIYQEEKHGLKDLVILIINSSKIQTVKLFLCNLRNFCDAFHLHTETHKQMHAHRYISRYGMSSSYKQV